MRTNRITATQFWVSFILLFLCSTEVAYSQCKKSTVLINARIIDGTGAEPREGWDVLICDDKIIGLESKISIPKNTNIIDATSMSILPGLIDMHGHIYANLGPTKGISNQRSYLKLYLAGGVTTIYSPGEYDAESTLRLQKKIEHGQEAGPDILTAGPYFDHDPSQIPWIQGARSIEEIESQFNLWKDKIDGIKVYTSITEAELKKVIELADKQNLPVTGHLGSLTAAKAIDLGIDGLEHGIFGMPEFFGPGFNQKSIACQDIPFDTTNPMVTGLVQKIVDNQVYITPTIVTLKAMLPDFKPVTLDWKKYLSNDVLESYFRFEQFIKFNQDIQNCIPNVIEKQYQLIKEINNKGGLIVTGTDPVGLMVVPGYGLHREMELLVEAGLTPMEAIQAATLNAAKALRKDAEFGSIEVGKLANLVVVQGNPSKNISAVGNIIMVFKRGIQYNPTELRESVLGKIGADIKD